MDKGGLTHTLEKHSGYSVLALDPAMNGAQWGEIERIGNEVLKDLEQLATPHLVVDLSKLDYIGSSMVALVVRIWKLVKSKNARMVVVNKSPLVLEVFKIAKLDEVWEIVEFREDALDSLGVSQAPTIARRETNTLMIVSLLAAVASSAALAMHLTNPGLLMEPLRSILIFACSGIGLAIGILFAVRSQGSRQAVGILATLISAGVLIAASVALLGNASNAAVKESDANAVNPETKTAAPQNN